MCGCCKACARELDGQEARQRGILDAVKEMIPLDLLLAVPVPGVNIEEHLQLRQEEKRQRVIRRHRLEDGRGPLVFAGPIFMNHREQALARLRSHPAQLKHKRDKHKGIWSSLPPRWDALHISSTRLDFISGEMHKTDSSALLLWLCSLRRKGVL